MPQSRRHPRVRRGAGAGRPTGIRSLYTCEGGALASAAMAKALATADSAALLVSLARNIPGAFYRCTVDPSWTMHLIGDEI